MAALERVEPLMVDANAHTAAIVGDEPLLLARIAPCWVGTDRLRSAKSAVEAGANALVLDDGLQNPALVKDLAFAVVDGETGFGNGLCVPAGPLRAPVSAQLPFVRALIVLGGEEEALSSFVGSAPGKPLIRASLEPDAVAAAPLIGREVVAFAGIARPEKFYATLRRVGARIVMTRDFADHHPYTSREIEALIEEAGRRGALLATTEKDLVRLGARHARAVVTLPVTLRFEEPGVVQRMLRQALRGRRRRMTPSGAASDPADEVRGAFRDHDRWRVGVTPHNARHHRGVDHAQTVNPMHLQFAIDHRPDRAGAGRMINGPRAALDEVPDIGFGP